MRAFYRWWKKANQGGINEYHAYEGWKAALEWVLDHRYADTDESLYDILQRELGNGKS